MCGIYGAFSKGKLTDTELNRVRSIGPILQHRGPDGEGFWYRNNIALGHRRLSILDATNSGAQPMSYKNGRYTIVYNGEIYNFIELKSELKKAGYAFSTDTDTEVVIAAYDYWGKKCLDKFNGMWAFALWDSKEKILLLSRDRFGVKPLYYTKDGDHIVFSSEVKGVHHWLGKKVELNNKIISKISQGSRIHHGTRDTHLKNVYSVPAGHNLIIKNGSINIYKWYNLKLVNVADNLQEQANEFRDIFVDACNIRLRSDVSIASCLSGGVDSSSIVSVIHKKINTKDHERRSGNYHKAFTMGFSNTFIDEGEAARAVANELGFDHDILEMTVPSIDGLEQALSAMDGPMPNLAFYPIHELYSFIRKSNIKVTLDGMGPDEMLGGYFPLKDALKASISGKNMSWAVDVFKTYRSMGENQFESAKKEANSALIHVLLNSISSFFKKINFESGEADNSTLTPEGLDSFQQNLFNSFFQNTLPMLLNQYEICSMANGIESRMPFLDYRLVEYIFSLPNESRVGGGYTKRILRESMSGIVPKQVLKNKVKMGFHPPQIDWFSGSMREWMLEIATDKSFIESTFFDGKKFKDSIVDFDSKKIHNLEQWNHIGDFYGPICVTWWMQNKVH